MKTKKPRPVKAEAFRDDTEHLTGSSRRRGERAAMGGREGAARGVLQKRSKINLQPVKYRSRPFSASEDSLDFTLRQNRPGVPPDHDEMDSETGRTPVLFSKTAAVFPIGATAAGRNRQWTLSANSTTRPAVSFFSRPAMTRPFVGTEI
ncbi:MAG: hypothetical protein NTY01_14915 [Verrucomicrobia bacterium]|nr:hypothetical protein [Verrucomicrobiota bacterium]